MAVFPRPKEFRLPFLYAAWYSPTTPVHFWKSLTQENTFSKSSPEGPKVSELSSLSDHRKVGVERLFTVRSE